MVIRKLTLLLLLAGSCSSGDNTPSLPTFDPDALISVSGTMIDIRDVRSGDALYPQNDDFKIPQEFAIAFGSNMHYATTLREYRGVERVSANHPTILRIAVADNIHPGSMWTDSHTSFRIGSLRMHLPANGFQFRPANLTPQHWFSAGRLPSMESLRLPVNLSPRQPNSASVTSPIRVS